VGSPSAKSDDAAPFIQRAWQAHDFGNISNYSLERCRQWFGAAELGIVVVAKCNYIDVDSEPVD